MVKIKEYELSIEQMKVDAKRVDAQEKRKNMELEADQAKRKAEYQDQLARRRLVKKNLKKNLVESSVRNIHKQFRPTCCVQKSQPGTQ